MLTVAANTAVLVITIVTNNNSLSIFSLSRNSRRIAHSFNKNTRSLFQFFSPHRMIGAHKEAYNIEKNIIIKARNPNDRLLTKERD